MVSTVCGMVIVLISALELNEAPATADEWGYRPSAELPDVLEVVRWLYLQLCIGAIGFMGLNTDIRACLNSFDGFDINFFFKRF
jgi:hypothetical protein